MASETQNYGYPKPDADDFYDVGDFSRAMDMIDGDMAEAKEEPSVEFTQAEARENIRSGEKLSKVLGKVQKFFADLKTVAFTGSYGDLSGKPEIPDAVRVKGSAEGSYRTGDVDIAPADIGSPSNEYMAAHFVPDYIKSKLFIFGKGKKWVRIAEFQEKNAGGYNVNSVISCNIIMRRQYNSPAPELHEIQLIGGSGGMKFVNATDYGDIVITKIRLVWIAEKMKYALDVYYNNADYGNAVCAFIEGATAGIYGNWELTGAEEVPETGSGVTVLAAGDMSKQFTLDRLAKADGSNVSGTWANLTAGKAAQDGDGNVIKDTYAKKSIYGDKSVLVGKKAGYASGSNSFSFGEDVLAHGDHSAVLGGHGNVAYDNHSAVLGGYESTARGNHSVVLGGYLNATYGENSVALGGRCNKVSNYASCSSGKYNKAMAAGGSDGTQVGDVFVIGNGTGLSSLSNALRVTYQGEILGTRAFQSSGADYAEYIKPWADGNPDNEDRVGYFVTVRDGLLHKAGEGDYVCGITSGNPSVVGNADEDYYWRYERDEFNRIVMEDVPETVQKTDEEGNPLFDGETHEPVMAETGKTIKNARMKLAEDYDPSLQGGYVERKNRKEWDYVGMVGVLPVRDDGTCLPGHFCRCGQDGIATSAAERGFDTFYVIERINGNVVSVELR